MLEFLETVMEKKKCQMTSDERTLVQVALKNSIKKDQKLWRTLIAVEQFEKFN